MSESRDLAGAPVEVLIMAGGTGGHVYPALAVARVLAERGARVAWLGTRQGLEARVVAQAGVPLYFITVGGLRGKGWRTLLAAPLRLVRALAQAVGLLRRLRPSVALGMGGFASGPGGLAARLLGRPLVVHEQNAIPGLTNRLLGRIATRVLEAFPGSFPAPYRAVHTGNPVRAELLGTAPPAQRLGERAGPLRLLVLGGSLGARALNEVVPETLARLPAGERPAVWHQAGPRHLEATRSGYASRGVEARVVPFIEDMVEAYAWADLVLCRAGAMTIAELAAVGVGALLVPYPHAVDDHQTHNARWMAATGAALLVPQEALAERLQGLLRELAGAPARLLEMACAARRLARPRAAQAVAEVCLGLARG